MSLLFQCLVPAWPSRRTDNWNIVAPGGTGALATLRQKGQVSGLSVHEKLMRPCWRQMDTHAEILAWCLYYLSVCLLFCLQSFCLSFGLYAVFLTGSANFFPSLCLSVSFSRYVGLFAVFLSLHLSVSLSFCLSVSLSAQLSLCLSNELVGPSTCLSCFDCFCLFWLVS